MNADPLVRAGQRVGKYILGDPIARGGMAEVWAARVEGPQGFVKSLALKFTLDSFAGDPDLERLFVNEARLAAQLQHANLVSVFDFDKIPDVSGQGRYYIAMERVEGHDLRRVLQNLAKRGRRLPPALALHIAGEVLKGLRYVHERRDPETLRPLGLVHRDVSPHNILIGLGGEVKLSDFGIAKAMAQSLGTKAGMIRGKLAYASPEQLRSEPFNHRTDQFALGVTLWEALAGQRLFDGTSEMEIMGKVLRCEIPLLPLEAGVAAATEAVVRHMLAAQQDGRYASTAEALSAVLACPDYTPDGAGLEALMQELFAPQSLELPPTLPLDAALGPSLARPASGSTKVAALNEALAPPPEIVAYPGGTTPAIEPPAAAPRPLGDGIPVPRPVEGGVPDSTTFADRERSVTGSAYVSTADGVPPLPQTRGIARAAAVTAALVAGAALVVVVARQPWQEPRPVFRPAAVHPTRPPALPEPSDLSEKTSPTRAERQAQLPLEPAANDSDRREGDGPSPELVRPQVGSEMPIGPNAHDRHHHRPSGHGAKPTAPPRPVAAKVVPDPSESAVSAAKAGKPDRNASPIEGPEVVPRTAPPPSADGLTANGSPVLP